MEDAAPELLKRICAEFDDAVEQSSVLKSVEEKILKGTASYAEANQYAIEVGEILANAYKNNISSDVLPDGKMYYNIANRIITPTMSNNYELISKVSAQIQKILNENAGIGINAVLPEMNTDRVDGIVNRVSNAENYDKVSWILQDTIVNFSQSIVDAFIKTNSEFQGKAGLSPKIVRKVAGRCCKWCSRLAGTYLYPDVPDDVYRRHQRCRCTVEYDPKDGKVQNVHSKQWRNGDVYDRILMSKQLEQKETIKKLLKLNSSVPVSIPAKKIDTDKLEFDSIHINLERVRKISINDAINWINQSFFSVNVWNGKYERFFSRDGAAYVDLENNLIRTAYRCEDYTKNIKESLEVLQK